MMDSEIQFTLNGKPVRVITDGNLKLLWILRTSFGLTGSKYGCGEGHCGSCTVLINNEAVRSCLVSLTDVSGKEIVTIEGLAGNGDLHPVQKAFIRHDALQCGYCTPGMILNAVGLLVRNPNPSRSEIIREMDDNICRCGAYNRIIDAIESAADEMRGNK
jgi:aerobic-type carbon monoxide dehydrogenase small subunit (CoxS/CutS family)